MSKSSKKEKVIPVTFLSPEKGVGYVPDGFSGSHENATVICLGNGSVFTERVVHRPYGGNNLDSDEWVVSTRNEMACIEQNKDNPYAKDIARAVRRSALCTLKGKKLIEFITEGENEKVIVYSLSKLTRADVFLVAKKAASTLLKDVENQSAISKAGPPPTRPKVSPDILVPHILASEGKFEGPVDDLSLLVKNNDVRAEAGLTLLTQPALKKVVTHDLGTPPFVTYVDDMQEVSQVGVSYLKGVPASKVRATILRKLMGEDPAGGKSEKKFPETDPPKSNDGPGGESEEEHTACDSPDKVDAYLKAVTDFGDKAIPERIAKSYYTEALVTQKVKETGGGLVIFLRKLKEYKEACALYRENAKKAGEERKKRWSEAQEN